MAETTVRKMLRGAVVSFALLACAAPAFAQVSVFAANEVRAASVKDRLRLVKATLKDGSEGARRHSTAITEAFKDTADWAPATEAYYARKIDLVARAAALEAKLDASIARNAPERAEDAAKELDALCKFGDVLRSDYEFYMKLPGLADGPQRQAAQAAMRLLGQTGDYPVSFAYFLDKTPNRPPFAPLPPGVMSIRHK
jgi:hypothetical protein